MKLQSSLFSKNSGNYINYQRYSSSSAIEMISSSSIPTSLIEEMNQFEVIEPGKIELKQVDQKAIDAENKEI